MEVIASEWKPISTFCTWILNKVRSDSVNLELSLILSSFDEKICAPEINLRTGSGSELTLTKPVVNKTHSKSSPMRQRNSSTNGLFRAYTWANHEFLISPINGIYVYLLWLSWRWIRHTQRALPCGRGTRRRTVSSARTLGGSRCQSLLAQWNLRC